MNSDLDVRSNIKKRIADACRILGVLDITLGTLGHASARIPGSESFLIRGRGPAESGVRYTSSEDIITIDQNGQRVDGSDDGYLPPLEVHIHTELYRERPDINAVVHVHPQNPVLLSICNAAPLPIYGAYDPHSLDLVLSGIPIYTKSILVRTPELGQELATCMGDAEVCIMKGHGVTTAANSVEEAALHRHPSRQDCENDGAGKVAWGRNHYTCRR